ncbi:MAG TPA: glycosyl hydrolase family 65 protein [Geobacterales bacterium]|nr:glycosyl hydrolase family 65 protein [Geobacterales bacterium]
MEPDLCFVAEDAPAGTMTAPKTIVKSALEPSEDRAWALATEGYDPLRESSIESRFAVSNGFLGVRAGRAVTRGARLVIPPRTYVAGLFDTPEAEHAIPVLVPAPSWLNVHISVPGKPLADHPFDVPSHQMTLDMRRGLVLTQWHHCHANEVSMHLRTLRLVSLSERAAGLQVIHLEIDKGEAEITLEASFEGLDLGLVCERLSSGLGVWRTQYSGKRLGMATTLSLHLDGNELPAEVNGPLTCCWRWKCRPGQTVYFERMVALVRSDSEAVDPGPLAREKVRAARKLGWRGMIAEHEAAWARRWECSDAVIEGDPAAQQDLRFAIYHLNSAANPNDERVSIGARALTGEDYHGHVFWDTEIYLLPFYTWTWPEAARALLMYRFHTMGGARAKAARMGRRGALYAWESADTGEEATPAEVTGPDRVVIPVLCGTQEQHISADVAYAVWNYWQTTGDDDFLCDAGAEIILETGRFWASRAGLEGDGQSHIEGVIGPDEYHETIDESAYTNVMARWNIRCALGVAALLRERWPDCWTRLSSSLSLGEAELEQWRVVADTIVDGLDAETGLYEEFTGYFGLEKINLADYAGRTVPMDVVLGRHRTAKSQVVKQADVVALLALLPDEFPGDLASKNFNFYEPRCGHGSSLSPSLHGLAAARLGESEMALGYLRKSAAIDLSDSHVGIGGGIHIASLGGNWMLVVLGFAGLSLRSDGISLDPKLPAEWRSLAFAVQWRGRSLKIRIRQDERDIEASLQDGEPMTLTVSGTPHLLRLDHPVRARFGAQR